MSRFSACTAALALLAILATHAPVRAAESVVSIGGGFSSGRAILNAPPGRASVGVVLLPGGDGGIGVGEDGSIERDGNWIVRTRGAYVRSGIASLLVDRGTSTSAAIRYMRTLAPKVIVVAMSRGATRVAEGLSERPDGLVFASSMLTDFRQQVGDSGRLPRTLVIHHRNDTCRVSHADDVAPFIAWTGGRANLVWISGGSNEGNPCRGRAYHGFVGREGQVIGAITSFARGLR